MKNLLSQRCQGLNLEGDNLKLAIDARSAQKKDSEVINATIGTLYDENNKFLYYPSIDRILSNLNKEFVYSYASTSGGDEYSQAVLHWVFNNEKIQNDMHAKVCATPGGTGAVSLAYKTFLDKNESILVPFPYWGPYRNMAQVNEVNLINYDYIKDGKFNLSGFINKASEIIKKENKLVTILNDPANNPTGYTLSNDEFSSLINYFNSLKDVPVVLVYDVAYFDYTFGFDQRKKFELLLNANENVLISFAFSCSKSFSIYGLRGGAQILLSKSKEKVESSYVASLTLARTHWSNINHSVINLMIELDKDVNKKEEVIKDINNARDILGKRISLFNELAHEYSLDSCIVSGGFFAYIPFDRSEELSQRLKEDKIFVLPLKKGIRISLSSVNLNKLPLLIKQISKHIKALSKN